MRKKSPRSTECYAPSERQQEGRPWREENSAAVTKLQLHHKLQTDLQWDDTLGFPWFRVVSSEMQVGQGSPKILRASCPQHYQNPNHTNLWLNSTRLDLFFQLVWITIWNFIEEVCAPKITLSSKPGLTFSKEHQTGACRFDALSRANVPWSLSFT